MSIVMKVDLKALLEGSRKLYELILEEESIIEALHELEDVLGIKIFSIGAKRSRVWLRTSIGTVTIDFGRLSLRIDFSAETWLKLTSP